MGVLSKVRWKTLKYSQSLDPCLIFDYPTAKVRRRPMTAVSLAISRSHNCGCRTAINARSHYGKSTVPALNLDGQFHHPGDGLENLVDVSVEVFEREKRVEALFAIDELERRLSAVVRMRYIPRHLQSRHQHTNPLL